MDKDSDFTENKDLRKSFSFRREDKGQSRSCWLEVLKRYLDGTVQETVGGKGLKFCRTSSMRYRFESHHIPSEKGFQGHDWVHL